MTVQDFIKSLGGIGMVSAEARVPYTTIHSWVRFNRVPRWRLVKLAELATAKGLPVPATFEAAQ